MAESTIEEPDFEALERSAASHAKQRTRLFALMGNMNYCWSNNESMFIYILQYLMQTDEITATLVFGTLNTTRARTELVERLSGVKLRRKDMVRDLRRIIRVFNDVTKVRNEFNHAMFKIDQEGAITHTQTMRIQRKHGQLQLGEVKPIDDERVKQMQASITKMVRLNREIWHFLPRLKEYMQNDSARPSQAS
ncbi:hypothetical protein E1162_12145 [Rhodobacteraceae bacterium RKSG542]|uniref:hypothetical protein n=1 Tax=Pseudovibrio flavus TaxID=2529854 RepID=UPI0012BD4F7C|nr:hypothetical protein [Pseudovibrio flavus]MTI17988.1 hypothetical protein [Pseudovibrio flavus]